VSKSHVALENDNPSKARKPTKLLAVVGSFSLLLCRDSGPNDCTLKYDIALVECQGLDFQFETKAEGDLSITFTVQSIHMFDLGQLGRNQLSKSDYFETASVVLTGYCPLEGKQLADEQIGLDSQLVAKIEREGDVAHVTKVTLVVCNLRIVPLIGLLRDLTHFFRCEWSKSEINRKADPAEISSTIVSANENETDRSIKNEEFQFRFVLHYPQVVVLANEGDHHCRALILRG
jgi:hypothetical protein